MARQPSTQTMTLRSFCATSSNRRCRRRWWPVVSSLTGRTNASRKTTPALWSDRVAKSHRRYTRHWSATTSRLSSSTPTAARSSSSCNASSPSTSRCDKGSCRR